VGYTVQVGFFLPIPPARAAINQNGTPGCAAVKFLDQPDSLNVTSSHLDDAGVGQAVGQKRLGIFETGSMHNSISLRIKRRAHSFGQGRMLSQHQKGPHSATLPAVFRKGIQRPVCDLCTLTVP